MVKTLQNGIASRLNADNMSIARGRTACREKLASGDWPRGCQRRREWAQSIAATRYAMRAIVAVYVLEACKLPILNGKRFVSGRLA
jgi:hypothetical protein